MKRVLIILTVIALMIGVFRGYMVSESDQTRAMPSDQQERTEDKEISKIQLYEQTYDLSDNNLKGALTETDDGFHNQNLFVHDAELLYEDGYATIYDGKISERQINTLYNAYILPVDGESIYSFTECRLAFLVDSDKETAIGNLLQYVTQIDSTGASYICFSINKNDYPVSTFQCSKGRILQTSYQLPEWSETYPKQQVNSTGASNKKPKSISATGTLSNGDNLQIVDCRNNLRKNERVIFEGDITSFSAIKIGLSFTTSVSTDANQMNTFLIDGTNISYYARSTSTPVTVSHGLTITNNIQVIWEMTDVASCKITLISNGNLYEHEFTDFVRQTIGNPYVLSSDSSLTGCKLTWTCVDLDKNIWMFGDSYFSYSNDMWTYYLHQYGYDQNCLLDGYPGEKGSSGKDSFNNLLQFGTPKYAVWCLGMNDGTDSDSAPSADWASGRDSFLDYCLQNKVTPIFATIPTVKGNNPPTTLISNEKKNEWVKASGYRYIDFAKAVGANSNGEWYSGMLSSDGIHPTETGAKALFAQVLIDLPEIMVND